MVFSVRAADEAYALGAHKQGVAHLARALQHSIMARPAFKRWWTRVIPEAAERSTYVLASSLALVALFVFREPIDGAVRSVPEVVGR